MQTHQQIPNIINQNDIKILQFGNKINLTQQINNQNNQQQNEIKQTDQHLKTLKFVNFHSNKIFVKQFFVYYFYQQGNIHNITLQNIKHNQNKLNYLKIFEKKNSNEWPPNIKQAKLHQEANKLGILDLKNKQKQQFYVSNIQQNVKIDNQTIQICRCCGSITSKTDQSINICTPLNKIQAVKISTQLYFSILIWSTIMLTNGNQQQKVFLIYGLSCLIFNLLKKDTLNCFQTRKCSFAIMGLGTRINVTQNTQNLQQFFQVNIYEYSNQIIDNSYILIQGGLCLILVIIWQIFLVKMKQYFMQLQIKKSQKKISASDFTIMLEGLPEKLPYTEEDVKRSINEWWLKIKDSFNFNIELKIIKVNIVYDLFEYHKLLKKKKEFINQLKKIKLYRMKYAFKNNIKYQDLQQQIYPPNMTSEKINLILNKLLTIDMQIQKIIPVNHEELQEKKIKRTTYVFVTLETIHMLNLFLKYSRRSIFQKYVFDPISKIINKYSKFTLIFTYEKYSVILQARKAPEPQDLLWQNFGLPFKIIIRNRLICFLFAAPLLIGFFYLLIYISVLQILVQFQSEFFQKYAFSIFFSIIIETINIILLFILRKNVFFQNNITITQFHSSYVSKATFINFFSTILIILLIGKNFKTIYFSGGIGEDIVVISFLNIFVPNILDLFLNFQILLKKFKKWKIKRQIKNNECLLTQKQINKKWEKNQFPIADNYIILTQTILFTIFFAPLQPIIIPMGVINLIIQYWVKKYLLFNNYKKPTPGDNSLNNKVTQIFQFVPFIFVLGNFIFLVFLTKNQFSIQLKIFLYTALGISCLFIFIPIQNILDYFHDKEVLYKNNLSFNQNKPIFTNDYDRLNPVTKQKALKQWIYQMEQKQMKQKKQKSFENNVQLSQNPYNKIYQESYENSQKIDLDKSTNKIYPQINTQFLESNKSKLKSNNTINLKILKQYIKNKFTQKFNKQI